MSELLEKIRDCKLNRFKYFIYKGKMISFSYNKFTELYTLRTDEYFLSIHESMIDDEDFVEKRIKEAFNL